MRVLIDYLQFTILDQGNYYFDDIVNLYLHNAIGDYTDIKGALGYKNCKYYNNIRIFYNGNENMGICIQISGQGCRFMETLDGFDWILYLKDLLNQGVKFTRIDYAIDCFDNEIKINDVVECLKNGEVSTRFKSYEHRNELNIIDNGVNTDTLYIGKRISNTFIRIYDKNLERNVKGFTTEYENWIRFEVVLKQENAYNSIVNIINSEDIMYIVKSIINNYIRFINLDNTNKSRCTNKEWWNMFINNASKLKITNGKKENDLIKIENWINSQVKDSLKLLVKAYGWEYVKELINSGKLNNEKIKILFEYKQYIKNNKVI